jgi:undecaprenyl-diphosphatase
MTAPSTPRSRRSYLELLRARWALMASLGLLAVGTFLKLTSELTEGELDAFDRELLSRVIAMRTPALNGAAVDITALGSVTVVTLVVIIAGVSFALGRHWGSVAQLLIASIGGGLTSDLLKPMLERERPAELGRLVHVASYSYPSGHSLASASVYLTLAILVARHVSRSDAQRLVIVAALFLAIAVGFSRAYIGVHYPSDILAGFLLGSGWALLVSAVFSYLRGRGTLPAAEVPYD